MVLARAHRLAFVNRRLRTRRALNEKIAMLYHRPAKRSVVVSESGVGGGGGEWKGTTFLAVETKAASSLTNRQLTNATIFSIGSTTLTAGT